MKILLDTDIGCDQDDMQALGYLLARQDAELVGITSVGGEVVARAKLADLMCRLAGKDIPVHAGTDVTLDGRPLGNMCASERVLTEQFPCNPDIQKNTAVEFMRRTIEENPHEITLCAIGMLTNIAALFTKYPHVIPLLRRMVIMAGRFGDDLDISYWGEQEYNIRCDKNAAKIVYEAPVGEVWAFGVEMTCRVRRYDTVTVADNAQNCKWLIPFANVIRHCKAAWYHDVVAVASLFWKDGMEFERGSVRLSEDGDTVFTPNPNGNLRLLRKLDIPSFLSHFCTTLNIPV